MQITIFVEPKSFGIFLEVTSNLKQLDLENNYVFEPKDLIFSDIMVSNWLWFTMDISEYLKLIHAINRLSWNYF